MSVDGAADVNANARAVSASVSRAARTAHAESPASRSILTPRNRNLDNISRVYRDTGADDIQKPALRPPEGIERASTPIPIRIKRDALSPTPESGHDAEGRAAEVESEVQDDCTPYGPYCSQEKSDRIETWVNDVAHHNKLEDAGTPIDATANVYKDWLDWSKETATSWLRRLDRYEQRFRTVCLKYHKLPYQVRHLSKLLYGSSVEQIVLDRLSAILETDRARAQQAFFYPWFEVKNVADSILNELRFYHPLPDDCDFLRTVLRKFELSLLKMPKACRTLLEGLHWLEESIDAVMERSDLDGSEALFSAFTREGGLLRRWIQTLPELDSEVPEMKLRYIEWYADRLLDIGVEEDQYWSSLVDQGDLKGETSKS